MAAEVAKWPALYGCDGIDLDIENGAVLHQEAAATRAEDDHQPTGLWLSTGASSFGKLEVGKGLIFVGSGRAWASYCGLYVL
jgi:hypothetical protein